MRSISFSLTTPQFLDGTKDVTRRLGWEKIKAGDTLRAVKKAMGLKTGIVTSTHGSVIAALSPPLASLQLALNGFSDQVKPDLAFVQKLVQLRQRLSLQR